MDARVVGIPRPTVPVRNKPIVLLLRLCPGISKNPLLHPPGTPPGLDAVPIPIATNCDSKCSIAEYARSTLYVRKINPRVGRNDRKRVIARS